MGQNAVVNIILIEPKKRDKPSDPGLAPGEQQFRSRLTGANPTLLRSVQRSFAAATYDRFVPKHVIVTRVSGKLAIGCMSDDPVKSAAQDELLQDTAFAYNQPGELNIIAIDQQPCGYNASGGETGGYDVMDSGEDPVVNARSFNEGVFENTVDHEFGHGGGLDHAGTATCTDAATISNCALNPTDDPLSLMGYTEADSAHRYSYPELAKLGLIRDDEVQTIAEPGLYTLHTMNQQGSKVLVLDTGKNEPPIYFSYEADPTAAYDEKCIHDQNIDNPHDHYSSNPNVLSEGSNGTGQKFVCLAVNRRPLKNSVQVRAPEYSPAGSVNDAQNFLADVLRPERVPNTFDPQPETGEIKAGTVLYQNGTYTVTLRSIAGDNAVVQVSPTTGA